MSDAPKKIQPRVTQGFDLAVADEIVDRMVHGESLVKICADAHLPHRVTIYRWMDAEPAFAARCARAREALADYLVDQIEQMAEQTTEENFQSQKVRISTAQWRASKIAPRIYGDKLQTQVTGADGGPVQLASVNLRGLSDAELTTMKTLLGKAKDPT